MAASKSLPFTIPKRIHRSKTAILKALSSTVGVDKTAPHFSFIDDPTTIPTAILDRRNYFLAREFGRRAARQLAVEWPTLFMFDRDKPRLEAFRPEKLPALVEAEQVDENSLRQLVDGNQVEGALQVFERLRANNTKLSKEVLTDLFRIVAYFNAKDPPPTENEEWHGIRAYYFDPQPDISHSNELINLLYSMVEPNASNHSTLISWLCKYGPEASTKRVLELFDEANKKKWILEEDAYIGLINKSSDIDSIINSLKAASQVKAKPSIRLFNAAIRSISKFSDFNKKWSAIQKCLGEVARLGLEPNLTTYSLVLIALRPTKDTPEDRLKLATNCLSEILPKLEAQPSIPIRQFTDQHFFTSAMIVAISANNDPLMNRVEQLYSSKKNQVKMSAFTIESAFYSRYLVKKIHRTADIAEIEKLYMELVPRVVGVTSELLALMTRKLKGTKNWTLTKRVIEDGLCARELLNTTLLQHFLKLLDEFQPNEEQMSVIERDGYEKLIVKIVDYLLEFANFDESEKFLHHKLHPAIMSDCVVLLLRTAQTQKAWTLIDMLVRSDDFQKQVDSEGHPNRQSLLEAFDYALSEGSLKNAANCLELVVRHDPKFRCQPYVDKLSSTFQLGNMQKQVLLGFAQK